MRQRYFLIACIAFALMVLVFIMGDLNVYDFGIDPPTGPNGH